MRAVRSLGAAALGIVMLLAAVQAAAGDEVVRQEEIEVVPDEQEANSRALEMAQPDDLILMLGDNVTRTWKQIIYFNSGTRAESGGNTSSASVDLPDFEDFDLDSDVEIISDERGVRIAREEGD